MPSIAGNLRNSTARRTKTRKGRAPPGVLLSAVLHGFSGPPADAARRRAFSCTPSETQQNQTPRRSNMDDNNNGNRPLADKACLPPMSPMPGGTAFSPPGTLQARGMAFRGPGNPSIPSHRGTVPHRRKRPSCSWDMKRLGTLFGLDEARPEWQDETHAGCRTSGPRHGPSEYTHLSRMRTVTGNLRAFCCETDANARARLPGVLLSPSHRAFSGPPVAVDWKRAFLRPGAPFLPTPGRDKPIEKHGKRKEFQ